MVIDIAGRKVGLHQPCFVIAEAGVNHNGDFALAKRLIDIAKESGAHAVKFQTFIPEKVISPSAPKAAYQTQTTDPDESQLDMVRKLQLSFDHFVALKEYCESRDILFLSTPFDHESADFLDELGMVAFKIPSGEITNTPFIRHLAAKGKPLIVSTGMSTLAEVDAALTAIADKGNQEVMLLHCVSSYPAPAAEVNLRAMKTMAQAFKVPVGYSDHTKGLNIALAAVALGACIIEKHFTLDRNLPGPDHQSSLEPNELGLLVAAVREVESALGDGNKQAAACERDVILVARRSLVASRLISAGAVISADSIAILRPGTGLPPFMIDRVLGRRARTDISPGTILTLEMLV
jgi:N-acetylneuraminate synthase/N,N'-diacetyllegionaminate synthase